MTHVGAYTDASSLGSALQTVSYAGNSAAVASIIDNITSTQLSSGQLTAGLDATLENLALYAAGEAPAGNPPVTTTEQQAATTEIKDFMTHVGVETDASSIATALVDVSYNDNTVAVASIIDNITSTQLSSGQLTAGLDFTLQNLASYAAGQSLPGSSISTVTSAEQKAATAEINDFMTHVGAYTDTSTISNAVSTLAHDSNIAALDNIFSNLTDTQRSNLTLPVALGNGKDLLVGTVGNDSLQATFSNGEALFGGAGNDTLIGSTGADTLCGGTGKDTFVFNSLTHHDTVADFSTQQGDVLNLHDVLHFTSGMDITKFIEFTTSGSNTIVSVSASGSKTNWVEVAQLDSVTGLSVTSLYSNHEIIG